MGVTKKHSFDQLFDQLFKNLKTAIFSFSSSYLTPTQTPF